MRLRAEGRPVRAVFRVASCVELASALMKRTWRARGSDRELPKEMREALAKLVCPCESDRAFPEGLICDEEATHRTPSGTLLCTDHALVLNARFQSHGWPKDKEEKYLAVPRS